MKIDFIGFQGARHNHQDWAIEIKTETGFEQTFLHALFRSSRFPDTTRQPQPIAALLFEEDSGLTIMVSAENYRESPLVKAQERIAELEKALKEKAGG